MNRRSFGIDGVFEAKTQEEKEAFEQLRSPLRQWDMEREAKRLFRLARLDVVDS